MITIQTNGITPLPCYLDCIGSLAYNGCGYAMLTPRSTGVTQLDEALCPIETVCTKRTYNNLCYDKREHCYWASEEGHSSILYRLDPCFCECGRLVLAGVCGKRLFGISCDPCSNALLLMYPDSVMMVDKCSGQCSKVPCSSEAQLYLGILALCNGYLLSYMSNGQQYIEAHCPHCIEQTKVCVPKGFSLEAMVLCGLRCDKEQHCILYEIGLLLSKQRNSELSLMRLMISCCEIELPHCPPCPPVPPPCPPVPPCPPCKCGKYEIMHSIALEEAAIAHILNAEGEKLQKAVAESATIGELLCVNESVKRTITQITQLEGQLFSKLESLHCICDKDCCTERPGPECGGNC